MRPHSICDSPLIRYTRISKISKFLFASIDSSLALSYISPFATFDSDTEASTLGSYSVVHLKAFSIAWIFKSLTLVSVSPQVIHIKDALLLYFTRRWDARKAHYYWRNYDIVLCWVGLLAQCIAFSDEMRFVYRLVRYPFSEHFDFIFFLFSPKPFLCRRLSHFHTAIDWMYTLQITWMWTPNCLWQ